MPPASTSAVFTEVRANLRLAGPLIGAQMAAVGMGAIDTLFAGRLGPSALAAVTLAVNVNVVFLILVLGLAMACSPILAQLRGAAAAPGEIASFLIRARRFAHGVGVLWALALLVLAPPLLRLLGLAPETERLAIGFSRWLAPSGWLMSLWFVRRFCAEGLGQTVPIVGASLLGLCANALFGWLLVFGHAGLPALGVRGCALANTVAAALMVAYLDVQFRWHPGLRDYRRASPQAGLEGMRSLLRLGLPVAGILLAEAGLFVVAALLMSRFGESVTAAYQVAINVASLLFMIPLGVAMATTVRVGLAIGADATREAVFRGWVGVGMGAVNAASNATLMLSLATVIARLYTRDPQIAGIAAGFLRLAAAFQLFDGVQSTVNGALRGFKDTRVPMGVTLASYWGIGLPVALGLAFETRLGPAGLWWGLTAGLGAAAFGLTARFAHRAARPAATIAMPQG